MTTRTTVAPYWIYNLYSAIYATDHIQVIMGEGNGLHQLRPCERRVLLIRVRVYANEVELRIKFRMNAVLLPILLLVRIQEVGFDNTHSARGWIGEVADGKSGISEEDESLGVNLLDLLLEGVEGSDVGFIRPGSRPSTACQLTNDTTIPAHHN